MRLIQSLFYTALSSVATDVESTIKDITDLLDEEAQRESEFQVRKSEWAPQMRYLSLNLDAYAENFRQAN